MATTYRFPVLVWEDYQGYYTAKLIEYEENSYFVLMINFMAVIPRR